MKTPSFLFTFLLSTHPSTATSLLQPKKALMTIPQKIITYANSYSSSHGLLIENTDDPSNNNNYQPAPISLLPQIFPKSSFQTALKLSTGFNTIMDRISRDVPFLVEHLDGVDPDFTGRLLTMYREIYGDSNGKMKWAQGADRLGILRSDYMLSRGDSTALFELKQIECNTIASSFGGLAVRVANLHRNIMTRFPEETLEFLNKNKEAWGMPIGETAAAEEGVPENPALEKLTHAMKVAHRRYEDRYDSKIQKVILFVVQEGERNTVDQRMLEFQLWDAHHVPVIRMSLTAAQEKLQLREEDGALLVEEDDGVVREVSLVYFRAGYAPTDYPTEKEWSSRETIEMGRCAKCPNLGYHLAGTKKVQQVIAKEGVLDCFFQLDETHIKTDLQAAFAGLYSLNEEDVTDADRSAVRHAMQEDGWGKYVLKPQREGGGYNYYNQEMGQMLIDNVHVSPDAIVFHKKMKEFILMERLFPPSQQAVLLRAGNVEGVGESISELGCYGTILSEGGENGKVCLNEYAGFLLRTKFSNVDEGGVASGFATLSSPYLC